MIYVTMWYFLSMNSQLKSTLSLRMDQHRPNIHTLLTYGISPWFYFFNLLPILCTLIIPIHESYFFLYIVLNTNITFETNLSILSNTITKFIPPNHHASKTSTTPIRFLHILQLRFTQVTQLSGFYFSKKELS